MKETFSFLSARSGPQPDFPLHEAMGDAIESFFQTHDFGVFVICAMATVGAVSIAGCYAWSRSGPK